MAHPKKDAQLGINFCTASARLKKNVLFMLVNPIFSQSKNRSIGVVVSCQAMMWSIDSSATVVIRRLQRMQMSRPAAFSHLKCNVETKRRPTKYKTAEQKAQRNAARRTQRANQMREVYDPVKRSRRYLQTGH